MDEDLKKAPEELKRQNREAAQNKSGTKRSLSLQRKAGVEWKQLW
jgi:hypothetical protein